MTDFGDQSRVFVARVGATVPGVLAERFRHAARAVPASAPVATIALTTSCLRIAWGNDVWLDVCADGVVGHASCDPRLLDCDDIAAFVDEFVCSRRTAMA